MSSVLHKSSDHVNSIQVRLSQAETPVFGVNLKLLLSASLFHNSITDKTFRLLSQAVAVNQLRHSWPTN